MHRDVLWIPEGFSCMWRLSSINKDLTEPDKAREKSPALRGVGIDMNADNIKHKHKTFLTVSSLQSG